MKREYSSPVMEIEVFEASEYVASCYTCMKVGEKERVANGILYFDEDRENNSIENPLTCGGGHTTELDNDPPIGYWSDLNPLNKVKTVFYWRTPSLNTGKEMYHIVDASNKTNAS